MRRIVTLAALAALLALAALPGAALARPGQRAADTARADANRNRLPDAWELRYRLRLRPDQAALDADRDGLSNAGEFAARTSPRDADSDNDRVSDADEDPDRDRVDNGNELRERTSPVRRDSDRDRRPDGAEDFDRDGLDNAGEDATSNDPADPDSDDDGVRDGAERAGRVLSFANDRLTVSLAGGRRISGLVTEETEVWCETEDEHEAEEPGAEDVADPHALDEEPGDEGAPVEPGDDEGELEPEPGEDEGDEPGDDGEDGFCGPEALKAGTPVHEAELRRVDGRLVFTEMELVR